MQPQDGYVTSEWDASGLLVLSNLPNFMCAVLQPLSLQRDWSAQIRLASWHLHPRECGGNTLQANCRCSKL